MWRSKVPTKVAFFSWTASLGKILTTENLWYKGVAVVDWCYMCVRVLFSLAHRPKDPGPNSYILVDWAWFTAAKYGLITNQVVRKSHRSPQGKNAIPPKQ